MPIEQRSVSRCTIDHSFSIEFHEGEQVAVVRIEGDFTVIDQERVHALTPSVPVDLGPAVALFGQVVRSARASSEGKLELTFEDGRILSVEPDAHYEAWEISGPDGMRAVCTPGGTISVWQPRKTRTKGDAKKPHQG